jgi:hypothetical protein
MSAKHTPGPWKVRASPHGKRYACVQIGRDEAYTTLELEPADARLIAAAPELLEALKAIRDHTFVDAEGPELRAQNELNYRRAVEAIARAEAA